MSQNPLLRDDRWYDQFDNIQDVIHITEQLPDSLRDHIGENLLGILAEYQNRVQNDGYLRQMGSKNVLSLYQSLKKRRQYDANLQMHKAVNIMQRMPDPVLAQLDKELVGFVRYIHDIEAYWRNYSMQNGSNFQQTEADPGHSLRLFEREGNRSTTPFPPEYPHS